MSRQLDPGTVREFDDLFEKTDDKRVFITWIAVRQALWVPDRGLTFADPEEFFTALVGPETRVEADDFGILKAYGWKQRRKSVAQPEGVSHTSRPVAAGFQRDIVRSGSQTLEKSRSDEGRTKEQISATKSMSQSNLDKFWDAVNLARRDAVISDWVRLAGCYLKSGYSVIDIDLIAKEWLETRMEVCARLGIGLDDLKGALPSL
jgi:hypothetical protein